ncbi:permease [Arcanobacterium haemolyticum]|uniref:permease n=1 Tax=Arcanobacterium haemolyticum TaxID=28264 RepID=UPI0011101AEC|nr:permease [Arcanobacterium haemolyticum]QCX47288.1 permease [Arcanobacterium haemolyticum]
MSEQCCNAGESNSQQKNIAISRCSQPSNQDVASTDSEQPREDAATLTPLGRRQPNALLWGKLLVAALVWVGLYFANEPWWNWFFGSLLGMNLEERLAGSLHFFFYDTVKILLLLTGLMFVIGMLRASFNMDKARDFLEGKGLFFGLVMAVALGVITPFCSCSSIPLFIGFVAAGIPLSITLTFLIASPLVSETAAILIGAQFGWDIAVAYLIAGSLIAIAIGWVSSRFKLDKWVNQSVFDTKVAKLRAGGHVPTLQERVNAAMGEAKDIFSKVWIWVIVGVGIGAAIHSWIPADFFATYVGPDNPLGVPLATILGVPLYANGGGVVPIGEALWAKGMPLGTVMSLMMGAIALSIPEGIMLRRVMKPQLLALFFGSVTVGIIIVGYLFNIIYA